MYVGFLRLDVPLRSERQERTRPEYLAGYTWILDPTIFYMFELAIPPTLP